MMTPWQQSKVPVWHILEGRFTVILDNAAHIRNVPGRKSDVNDATWIADVLAHESGRALCAEDR
jgi:hypothetical protein